MRYLLESNLYLGIFYLLYRLLLSRETHYALNRAYLLFSCLVSFALPVLQLGFLKPTALQPVFTVIQMPVNAVAASVNPVQATPQPGFSWTEGLFYLYLAGTLIFALLLVVKLLRLFVLISKQSSEANGAYKLVEISGSTIAFSFFSTVFIGADAGNRETIIRHEMVHIRQKHSIDILLLEFIRIVSWFNPVVYLLQNSLKAVHEYIADEKTASAETSALAYSAFLVNNAYGVGGPSLSHSFFNKNLLKQRIIMLHQKRSGNLAMLKYLLTLPVCAALLCMSTLAFSKTYGWVDLAPRHPKLTVSPALQLRQVKGDTNTFKYKGKNFVYKNATTTSKGFSYKETGYVVNGKTDFRVIITEKDGKQTAYFRSKCTPSDIKMLNEKYGYTFPSMDIFTKLPPPPPAPGPPAKPHGPKAPKLAPVDTSAQPAKPIGVQSPPPPMAPYIPMAGPFKTLQKYLCRNVLYPTAEFKKRIMGSTIIKFDINTNHKIANASLVKGFASACDNEALSVLKRFNETIDKAPGTYKLAITFYLYGLKAPAPASATLNADPSFVGEAVIVMYPN